MAEGRNHIAHRGVLSASCIVLRSLGQSGQNFWAFLPSLSVCQMKLGFRYLNDDGSLTDDNDNDNETSSFHCGLLLEGGAMEKRNEDPGKVQPVCTKDTALFSHDLSL